MKDVAVEVVVAAARGGRVEMLLLRLPGNVWVTPGAAVGAGRRLEEAAAAALAEQAGVRGVALEQLYSFDTAAADGVRVAYLALTDAGRHALAPGAEVVEVRWFPADDLPPLGDEVAETLAYGRARLRAKAAYAPIALRLLPEAVTLGELQAAYEALLERRLDTRNFRRDVLAADIVEPVGRVRADGPGRPARLYRAAPGEFQVLARERRIARAARGTPTSGGAPS